MNNPLDTTLVDRAILFATQAHAGTERRGKAFPYILHPFEAAVIVASITADPELIAAAILHDTVEDTDTTIDTIRSEFGERIALLVADETANKPKGSTWRQRKQMQIDHLASCSHDSKTVAIGDKLSNMRAIAADYRTIGDALWTRFHAPDGKTDIEWYYRGLAQALSDLQHTDPYSEFISLIEQTFGTGGLED